MKLCHCGCEKPTPKKYATRECWRRAQTSTIGNFYNKGLATDKLFKAFLAGDEKAKEKVNSKGARLTYWKRGDEEYKSH